MVDGSIKNAIESLTDKVVSQVNIAVQALKIPKVLTTDDKEETKLLEEPDKDSEEEAVKAS